MYLFYIDETGSPDPLKGEVGPDGTSLYVLTAVGVFAQKWHTFEKTINRAKLELIDSIAVRDGIRLELADSEIKSNWIRVPKARAKSPFLSRLTEDEVGSLVDLYYDQMNRCRMRLLSIIIDKRYIDKGLSRHDIQSLAWDRLLERVERFMRNKPNSKHQAILLNDDVSRQDNQRLAMTHAELMLKGTERDTWLRHICEMPMFVRSELCVGVQIADICSYNIYRRFSRDTSYEHFDRVVPLIWRGKRGNGVVESGIWVEGQGSPVYAQVKGLEKEQAPAGG